MTTETTIDQQNRATGQAKRPVSRAAGPYGHPFHPILVTVPIGAWVSSAVFDVASRLSGGSSFAVEAAFWLIGIGVVGAAGAAVFGFLDLLAIPPRTQAFRTGVRHMGLNVFVLGLYVGNFFWRAGAYDQRVQVESGQLALSLVALGLLGASGWLGGKLAYRFGVRVAEEVDQAEAFRRS